MNNPSIEIAPSILSADFRSLEREVKAVQDAGADRIHCDVMDGHFVPNITFGPLVVEAVKKCVSIPLDVHLMISSPERYIDSFCDAGADILTVHAETCDDLPGICNRIRTRGVRSGVTVNPDKAAELFLDHMDVVDQVLIMTVYAGFGGQKFIPEMLDKIATVNRAIAKTRHVIDLEVDGGIDDETAVACVENGVNVLVAGSYIFGADDYAAQIQKIRKSIPYLR